MVERLPLSEQVALVLTFSLGFRRSVTEDGMYESRDDSRNVKTIDASNHAFLLSDDVP